MLYSGILIKWKAKVLAKFLRYNKVSLCRGYFHICYYYLGKEYRSLYCWLCYIEISYIMSFLKKFIFVFAFSIM